MKIKLLGLSIVCGLFALLIEPASATLLVNETFSYADGALVGNTPITGGTWAAHSGAGTNSLQVTSGTTAVNGNGEDVNVSFDGGPIGAGAVVYAGFDLTVPTGSVTSNANFAHFLQGTSVFGARIWMTAPAADGSYRLALSGDNSITDGDGESFTDDLAFDTTYRVVTMYEYDTAATKLWINPVNESSTSISAGDGFVGDEYAAYALRQSTASSVQSIDNLMVATTFAEAAGTIPEPTTLGLAMASLGLLLIRRK